MTEQSSVHELLDRLVPSFDGSAANWKDVVHRAERAEVVSFPVPRKPRRFSLAGSRMQNRWAFRASLAAAVAAAALVATLLPTGGSAPSIVDKALAAVPTTGPIVHVVSEGTAAVPGQSGSGVYRVETWYDPAVGKAHVIWSRNGVVTEEYRIAQGENPQGVRLDAWVIAFGRYEELLRSSNVQIAGDGTVDGQDVTWLRFAYPASWESGVSSPDWQFAEDPAGSINLPIWAMIAVDSDTGAPVAADEDYGNAPDAPAVPAADEPYRPKIRIVSAERIPLAQANL